MQFDDIVKEIGGFGRYQKALVILAIFMQIIISMQALVPVFILSKHDHKCYRGVKGTVYKNADNISYVEISNAYFSQCSLEVFYNNTNITETEECTAWSFNTSELTSSPISDFEMVCDDSILKQHASMAFMGGNLFGSFILGFIGDTWGRKIVMYIGAVLLFGSSLGCAWANSFIFFVVLRFIAGASTTSGIGSLMIIMFETVDPAHRSHATVAVEVSWCLGEIILSGAAYFIRDWRNLQIAISCPGGILLLYWLFVPESARWLLSKGKGVKAMKIVQRAAYMNKRQTHIDAKEVKLEQRKSWNELLPLFQSCRLFVRFMVIAMLWFILSLSYYGLTFNVGRIGNNAYLEFIIYAVLEMVAYVSCLFINTRLGRKPLNIGAFLLAGVACISSTLISRYADGDNDWLIIVLSAIGRMGVSATFANAFVYTGELFPTTIRSFILACTNVATRTGAIISPYLTESGTNNGGGLGYTSLIFGVLTLAAGIVSCFLPETLNTSLPDNIDDMDGRRKQQFAQKNDDTIIATVL